MDHEPSIVCVYKTGGDFTPRYVRVLAQSVQKHMGMRLKCLSDDPSVERFCDYVPITNDWPKWWPKLELFQNFSHALYFDLDTVIKGDVSSLLNMEEGAFSMLAGFSGNGRGNSSVMAWRGDYSYIPDKFCPSMIPDYSKPKVAWGDQDFINDNLERAPTFLQNIAPGIIASRKKDCKLTRRNCKILCYHGKPRPHETGWAKI